MLCLSAQREPSLLIRVPFSASGQGEVSFSASRSAIGGLLPPVLFAEPPSPNLLSDESTLAHASSWPLRAGSTWRLCWDVDELCSLRRSNRIATEANLTGVFVTDPQGTKGSAMMAFLRRTSLDLRGHGAITFRTRSPTACRVHRLGIWTRHGKLASGVTGWKRCRQRLSHQGQSEWQSP